MTKPSIFREQLNPLKKREKWLKASFKSWSYEKLVDAIRNRIQSSTSSSFTVEEISYSLRAKVSLVQKAMYQMVREGLIHAPVNKPPHDVSRGGEHPPTKGKRKSGWSGWRASFWMRRK